MFVGGALLDLSVLLLLIHLGSLFKHQHFYKSCLGTDVLRPVCFPDKEIAVHRLQHYQRTAGYSSIAVDI